MLMHVRRNAYLSQSMSKRKWSHHWDSIPETGRKTSFLFGSEKLKDHLQIFHLLIKANYPSVHSVLTDDYSSVSFWCISRYINFHKAQGRGMYKFSKFFSDLQPYYPAVLSAIWSLSQKRPSASRIKQFQKVLPRQILQMMSGKTTPCQVCCWANICYLEKKTCRRIRIFSCALIKLVKSCFCISPLHIISMITGCSVCFHFFSSYINSPSINVIFYGKNVFGIWQIQLLLALLVRLNSQHLSFGVAILMASLTSYIFIAITVFLW